MTGYRRNPSPLRPRALFGDNGEYADPIAPSVVSAVPARSEGPWAQRLIGFGRMGVRCLACGAEHERATRYCPACGAGSGRAAAS